jgi:hypothetical protein
MASGQIAPLNNLGSQLKAYGVYHSERAYLWRFQKSEIYVFFLPMSNNVKTHPKFHRAAATGMPI